MPIKHTGTINAEPTILVRVSLYIAFLYRAATILSQFAVLGSGSGETT
jgi:hypothetical protein